MSKSPVPLSRRNAYHSTLLRSTRSVSSVSSSSASPTSSEDEDDRPTPTTDRHSLFLKAIEVNETAVKIERARERRRALREELQVKQGWTTSFTIIATSPKDAYNIWSVDAEETVNDVVAGALPSPPSLDSPSPPAPAPVLPLASDASPVTAATPTRPVLYPLLIPTQPEERPRSLQLLPRPTQQPRANRPRPVTWVGGEAQALQLASQSGSMQKWGVDEVLTWARIAGFGPRVVEVLQEYRIDGPLLISLDSYRLKSMGIAAFGTRFKIVESVRLLRSGAVDVPSPAVHVDTPIEPLRPVAQISLERTVTTPRPAPSFNCRVSPATMTASASSSPSNYSATPTPSIPSPIDLPTATRTSSRPPAPAPIPVQFPSPVSTLAPSTTRPILVPTQSSSRSPIDIQGPLSTRSSSSRRPGFRSSFAVLAQGSSELLLFSSSSATADTRPRDRIPLKAYRVTQTSPTSFDLIHSERATWSFRLDEQGEEAERKTRDWMKAIMKRTVEKDVRRPVYSSMASPTVSLGEAQRMGVGRGVLPEEWRERRLSGFGLVAGGSAFVDG